MNFKSTTHVERYLHFRPNQDYHWPLKHAQARTVFLRKEFDGTWNFSYADCSKKDQFCRKVGRAMARRRYFNSERRPLVLSSESLEPSFDEVLAQALREVKCREGINS